MDLAQLMEEFERLKRQRMLWLQNERVRPGTVAQGVSPEVDMRFRDAHKEKLNSLMWEQMNNPNHINGRLPFLYHNPRMQTPSSGVRG